MSVTKRNERRSLVQNMDGDEDSLESLTREEQEAVARSEVLQRKRGAACCDFGFWVNEYYRRFGSDYDGNDEPLSDDTLIQVAGTRKRTRLDKGQAQGGGGDNALCATQRKSQRFRRWKDIKGDIYFRFVLIDNNQSIIRQL